MLDRLINPFLDYWYWAQERETPLTRGLALAAPLVSFALVLYLLFGRGGDGSSLPLDVPATQGNIVASTQAPAGATQPASTGAQPAGGGSAVTPPAGTTPAPEPTAFEQLRYTVVSGDTPSGIAEKVGVPEDIRATWIQEMLALNGFTETTVPLGAEIILPPF
jgi:hypothetical protein